MLYSSEHIAPVLSVTPALDNSVIVSGGEDSRIIVTSLKTGEVVIKIDHHRGPVTAVHATASGDILISGSLIAMELNLLDNIVQGKMYRQLTRNGKPLFKSNRDNKLFLTQV